MKKYIPLYQVKPGQRVRLSKRPCDEDGGMDKEEGRERLQALLDPLAEWQRRLYAEQRQALLVVLQAMDAGGKDGVIRRVFSAFNPQGCRVTSFKVPTSVELAHDFLWRVHQAVPAHGEIGVFNRSHYEDVLVVRVHGMVPRAVWKKRYRQINDFERMLVENGTTLLKFYLHISREEQRRRLEERLKDPTKHWKADPADAREREHWDEYREAYEEAIERCSTAWAPWYVIPADRKWYRDLVVAEILLEALRRMNPRYPPPRTDLSNLVIA